MEKIQVVICIFPIFYIERKKVSCYNKTGDDMKKLYILLIFLCFPIFVKAEPKEKINIYFFYGRECPHCHEALTFFDSIKDEYGKYYNLITYETWYDSKNESLMKKIARFKKENKNGGVPYFIIGETSLEGYEEEDNEIILKTILSEYEKESRVDILDQIKASENKKAILLFTTIIGGFFVILLVKKKKEKKFKKSKK